MLSSIVLSVCTLCMSSLFAERSELVDSNQKAGMMRSSAEVQEGRTEEPLNGPNTPAQRRIQDRYAPQNGYLQEGTKAWDGSLTILLPNSSQYVLRVVDGKFQADAAYVQQLKTELKRVQNGKIIECYLSNGMSFGLIRTENGLEPNNVNGESEYHWEDWVPLGVLVYYIIVALIVS